MIPKTDVKSGLLVENAICNFLRRFRYALLGTYFLYKIPHSFFALGEKSHAVSCFFLGVQKRFTNSGWPAKQRSSGWDPSTYPSESVGLSQFWVLCELLLLSESESLTTGRVALPNRMIFWKSAKNLYCRFWEL